MRDTQFPSIRQFRPVSADDFSRYAKNLAWLIGEPLQRSQELLAQIYGFSGCHEIKQVLNAMGDPGPFDSDWMNRNESGELFATGVDLAGRSNRVLDLVARYKGLEDLGDMPSRWCDARKIGLFESPARHRQEFRRVRMKHEVLDLVETGMDTASARMAQEYAVLGETLTEEEYVLHFTDLGQAVFDAISEIVDRHTWTPVERSYSVETVCAKLDAITRQHPNNPWSRAAKVCFIGDVTEGRFDGNAATAFDAAAESIALFVLLYEGHEKQAPSHNLVTFNADTFYWPAILYWGGMAALECGKVKVAEKWLRLNKKLCPQDNFGVRFVLQELRQTGAKS